MLIQHRIQTFKEVLQKYQNSKEDAQQTVSLSPPTNKIKFRSLDISASFIRLFLKVTVSKFNCVFKSVQCQGSIVCSVKVQMSRFKKVPQ